MDLIPSTSSWSHEVSLFDESGSGGNLECVGTILSSYLILTVASCLYGKTQNKLTIKTKGGNGGNSNSKLEEQIRNISRIIFHPGFKNSTSENDLAILVLAQDLDINVNSGVKIMPILDESTSMNFSGRLCQEDFVFSSLEISDPLKCSSSSLKSDSLCLLALDSKENSSGSSGTNCSSPLPGSSLICSDEEHGQFLCGILTAPSEKMGETGQIYTNLTSHSKWIQSTSAKAKAKEPSDGADGDGVNLDDYKVMVNAPDSADSTKNTKSDVDYDVDQQILNGERSGPISYQLSLRFLESASDGVGEHICGGVIVDASSAVTAAHCFGKSKDASRYRVVAGEDRLRVRDEKEQVLSVKKIIIHPDFTNFTNGNDIAVFHMEKLKFNKYARAIWLSRFSQAELANKKAIVSGWGQISNEAVSSSFLQKGIVSILPPDDCQNRVQKKWKFPIQKGILCAMDEKTRTCQGDSGGPLVIQNYTLGFSVGNLLVGITSFGAKECERANTAAGFTEVSHFYDWIQENRAVKPCGANQLPCISKAECYDEDLRCDKEENCDDGTDELNCPEEITLTAPCGGFINLDQEHDLNYNVPSKERARDSHCLWIISTGRKDAGASIEVTILDNSSAQFNPSSDIIFINYNYTINNSKRKHLVQIGTKFTAFGPFTLLYYRTNSSAPNAGFHVKLRDSVSKSDITERQHVKVITIPNADFKTGEMREFSYPSSVTGASTYSSNESTIFILKPQKSGNKIRLNLTFVDTEEKHDWLDISSYRLDSLFLTRFSGRGNFGNKVREGLEDQPFYLYFHSDGSREGEGFKIQYSETVAPKPASCGGFIQVKGQQELVYKVPSHLRGQKSVCVWVVATVFGTSIETYVYMDPRAYSKSPESTLFANYDFRINNSMHKNLLAEDETFTMNEPFFVLYFRTNSFAPNSGFHIRLREMGEKETQKAVNYIELTDGAASSTQIQTFKYPLPPATNYTDHERTFIIVKPGTPHGKVKLNLKSVSTEKKYDWLQISTVEAIPTYQIRFNGEGSWSDKSFQALEDEPFIIYFHSDKSNTRSGFQFSYSEQKLNK